MNPKLADPLDDPSPPAVPPVATIVRASRRRTTGRRAATAAVTVAVGIAVGATRLAIDDGSAVDVGPAHTETTRTDTTSGHDAGTPARSSAAWSEHGVDFVAELPMTKAVPGGPVRISVSVTNATAADREVPLICLQDAPIIGTVTRLGATPVSVANRSCAAPDLDLPPGATRELTTTAFVPTDLGVGRATVHLYSDSLTKVGELGIEVVDVTGRAEITADPSLGDGQITEVALVVDNGTDALVPFPAPGPGPVCPLTFQAQVVALGTEPVPFAFPDHEACASEPIILEPGPNKVATFDLEVRGVLGDAEIVGAIDFDWPVGIAPPQRIAVNVAETGRPTTTMHWHLEPSDPIVVASGATAVVHVVVDEFSGQRQDLELLTQCPFSFVRLPGPLLRDQAPVAECTLTVAVNGPGQYPIEIPATYRTDSGSTESLPPGTYATTIGGFAVTLTVT
jgi:hypothetical protein